MLKRSIYSLALTAIVCVGCGAQRAPIPLGEIPRGASVTSADEEYGQQVLSTLTQTYPLSRDDYSINRVRDIVNKLADAAGATDTPWNVYVLRGDDVVNAAATRGKFLFVWTGMLNTAQSDGELAAVIAHEMGHVLADHTQPTPSEEASEILASVSGNVAGQVVSVQGPYGALGGLAGMAVEQAIKAFIVHPESQRKEFEADQIGIFLMADAGFDPNDALSLWSGIGQQGAGGADIPSFLSSHPANEERLLELEQLLPQASERYQVALSFEPRPSRKRAPQFEPDSFAHKHSGNPHSASSAQRRWLALEDGTTIFSSPNTHSRPLRRLRRDEPLKVGNRTGEWYEVSTPEPGYVLAAEIYPETP